VRLTGSTPNVTIGRDVGVGTILDDDADAAPAAAGHARIVEGDVPYRGQTAIVWLTLRERATEPTSFAVDLLAGTASRRIDYRHVNRMFTIDAGRNRVAIPIRIVADVEAEGDEELTVRATPVAGGAPLVGTLTIIDDEPPP
jgi:hypothetical protein